MSTEHIVVEDHIESVRVRSVRIMNAAGECKTLDHVVELTRSAVTDITVGSITALPMDGNKGNVFWIDPITGTSLNSLGLPNGGEPFYRAHLVDMANIVHNAGKSLRASIAGFSPEDYEHLADVVVNCGVDEVELNFGCPNVWGEDGQKPIASFVPDLIEKILTETQTEVPTSVKLSPYSDPAQLARVAAVIARSGFANFAVVCSNTFPNGLVYNESGNPVINSPQIPYGLAGVAGSALKPISLGQVQQFRTLLPESFDIIGVGGISTGRDVLDYLRAGADSVQVGTHYFQNGPRVFSEILQEFVDLVEAEE